MIGTAALPHWRDIHTRTYINIYKQAKYTQYNLNIHNNRTIICIQKTIQHTCSWLLLKDNEGTKNNCLGNRGCVFLSTAYQPLNRPWNSKVTTATLKC